MIEIILNGGLFMLPILLCSILSLAIFIEKLWVLQKKRVVPHQFIVRIEHLLRSEKIEEAIDLSKKSDSPISRILINGIKNFKTVKT